MTTTESPELRWHRYAEDGKWCAYTTGDVSECVATIIPALSGWVLTHNHGASVFQGASPVVETVDDLLTAQGTVNRIYRDSIAARVTPNPGDVIPFEGGTATVVMANRKIHHFDSEGEWTHETMDGLLLRVDGVSAVCLAKPDGQGGYVATIPAWRSLP